MWRALALAIGISLCILGGECLLIDKAVLANSKPAASQGGLATVAENPKEIQPPEWAPWTLISLGAVVMLYSFTIPKRVGG